MTFSLWIWILYKYILLDFNDTVDHIYVCSKQVCSILLRFCDRVPANYTFQTLKIIFGSNEIKRIVIRMHVYLSILRRTSS